MPGLRSALVDGDVMDTLVPLQGLEHLHWRPAAQPEWWTCGKTVQMRREGSAFTGHSARFACIARHN